MTDTIIVGGGIAGLTSALALQRQGRKVRVFEQASRFGEVGAGLTLSQPATRGLFSLGLKEAIEKAADIPARACGADYWTGTRIEGPDLVQEARDAGDIPYFYQIHRADMHEILASAVLANDPDAITLGRQLCDLSQDETGVTATFVDGSTERGAVLIGADGVNSRVRTLLFGEEHPRFTGQVAYRFLVPSTQVEPFMTAGASCNYVGPGRSLLRYRIRHGSIVNGVAFVATDSWTGEGWSTPVETEELLEQFADVNDDVKGLMAAAPRDGTRKWALFDRDPMPQWTKGRVTLAGDSAHPMLPFLGLGAAMGIEDAVVLGRAFSADLPVAAALHVYEETRRERANAVLLESRRQGEIRRGEKPPTKHDRSNDFLYTYDPSTVELAAV